MIKWELINYYNANLGAAARTKNYSGAELEGVVKSAVSFALNRQISMDDLTKPLDEENIKVTMDDFLHALEEIIPAFGASTDDLARCRLFLHFFFMFLFYLDCIFMPDQMIKISAWKYCLMAVNVITSTDSME